MIRLGKKNWIFFTVFLQFSFIIVFCYYEFYMSSSTTDDLFELNFVPGWEMNKSRKVSDYIFPDVITTIMSSKNICSNDNPPRVIIIVCSSTENFLSRTAIRQTWARSAHEMYNIGIIFLLGLSSNEEINKMIKRESQVYNDVIIENFIDTYYNLTLKSLMMLKWVKNNCNNTSYIMKTDDDVYINMNNLIRLINILPKFKTQNTLLGMLRCAVSTLPTKREWNMPKYMYKESTYPNYLNGPCYLMSMHVALKLYKEAFNISIIHLEDIYITGLCSRQAGIQPAHQFMFQFLDTPDLSVICSVDIDYLVIYSHHVSYNDMYQIHHKLNTCKTRKKPLLYNELYSYVCRIK